MNPKTTRQAIRDSIIAQAAGAQLPQVLFSGGVVSLLILHLGGTDMEIGIFFMVFNLSMAAGLFLIPYLEVRSRKHIMYRWLFISFLAGLLILLIYPVEQVLGPVMAYWFLVLIGFLFRSADNLHGLARTPYLYDLLPARTRGRYFGQMRVAIGITGILLSLLAGWILGKDPGLDRFYIVSLIALSIYALRLLFTKRLPHIPPPREGKSEPLWRNLLQPIVDRNFRRFLFFSFWIFGMLSVLDPFLVPYLKVELGFPASLAIYAFTGVRLGNILFLIPWGKLADRRGNRIVFILSFALTGVGYLLLMVIPTFTARGMPAFYLAAAGFTVLGIGGAGSGIAYSVRMMYEAKGEFSGAYLTVAALVSHVSHALLPFFAGMLFEYLPRSVEIFHSPVFSKRVFLFFMIVHMLISICCVRFLRRIEEQQVKEILSYIVYTSLNYLNNQVLRISSLLRKR